MFFKTMKQPELSVYLTIPIPMRKLYILFMVFFTCNSASAQLDNAMGFLNVKRSFQSNFIIGEFQIGNKEGMHYLTVTPGFNFSKCSVPELSPYHVGTVVLDYNYRFARYESKKRGMQFGLGYFHYFKSLENEKEFIPTLGLEFNWLRIHDQYDLIYAHNDTGAEVPLSNEYNFHTLTCVTQGGFVIVNKDFYFKAAIVVEFFLPINDSVYFPSDGYNPYGGYELPVVGLEPSLQIGVGMKVY